MSSVDVFFFFFLPACSELKNHMILVITLLETENKGEVKLYSLVIVYTWAQENNTVCICSHSYMQKKKTKKKQKTQL